MNAKIVLLCVCFLLLAMFPPCCPAGDYQPEQSKGISEKEISEFHEGGIQENGLGFQRGRSEVVVNQRGSKTGWKIGPMTISSDIGGAPSFNLRHGQEFCLLPKEVKILEEIQDPSQFNYEKKEWVGLGQKEIDEGRILSIRVGNRYGSFQIVKLIPLWNSVDEVPKIFLTAHREERDRNGKKIFIPYEVDPADVMRGRNKAVIYDWKYWPNVVPESERASQQAGIKALTVPPLKNFYCNGISFSWETSPTALNYEVKLSSIEKLEFAIVKGAKLADINNLAKFGFNTANHWQGSYGKISVELNDIIIFRLNGDKCFAFTLLKVEDTGIVKTSSNEVKNKSVVYEQRDWSKAKPIKPPELVKTAQN